VLAIVSSSCARRGRVFTFREMARNLESAFLARRRNQKIRWEANGDNRLPGAAWSDVENEGLILSPCTLDMENHLKRTP
jgi:hypothetical protein